MNVLIAGPYVEGLEQVLQSAGHRVTGDLPGAHVVLAVSQGASAEYGDVPVIQYLINGDPPVAGLKTVSAFQYLAEKHGLEQGIVIGPPVPQRTGVSFSSSSKRFLLPGGFVHGNGLQTVLRAMTLLPESAELLIAGEEAHRTAEDVRNMAVELGISGRVEVSNSTPSGDFLAGVLPSLLPEPDHLQPAVLLSAGLPALAAPSGCHREMVRDGLTGLYHSPGNHRQLSRQMNHLLENSGLAEYLSVGTGGFREECFSREKQGEMWTRVMEQLLQN